MYCRGVTRSGKPCGRTVPLGKPFCGVCQGPPDGMAAGMARWDAEVAAAADVFAAERGPVSSSVGTTPPVCPCHERSVARSSDGRSRCAITGEPLSEKRGTFDGEDGPVPFVSHLGSAGLRVDFGADAVSASEAAQHRAAAADPPETVDAATADVTDAQPTRRFDEVLGTGTSGVQIVRSRTEPVMTSETLTRLIADKHKPDKVLEQLEAAGLSDDEQRDVLAAWYAGDDHSTPPVPR